jgi:prefoldin subunit 5
MSVGEWLNSVIRPEDDADFGQQRRSAARDRDGDRRRGDRDEDNEAPTRRGGPYRDGHRRGRNGHSRSDRPRDDASAAVRETGRAREEMGKFNARLDALSRQIEELARDHSDLPPAEHASDQGGFGAAAKNQDLPIDDTAAATAGRRRALEDERPASRSENARMEAAGVDLAGFDRELRARLEARRPASDFERPVNGLRGDSIVSHAASSDVLGKVAEDVRSLAAKVDSLATSSASGQALSTLENRIETLASALNASTEAAHAMPRGLEKLLSGLIEKLEWVHVTHTDHAAVMHLEGQIANLVRRLDASDARLAQLDGLERGLANLLTHLEQIRGGNGRGEGAGKAQPATAIERYAAEIRRSERRTEDSLEAVQCTVEHVIDRLAMIESDMRTEKAN